MRIRRLTSKILGTGTVPPSPPRPAAAAATLLPQVAGQHQPALVCVLNQSPWDVLSWPPTPPPRLDPKERPPCNPKIELFMDAVKETGMDEESKTPPLILSLPASNSEEFHEITKKKKSIPTSTFGMKKKKKIGKKKGNEMTIRVKEEISGGGIPAATCNKTDGKQWKCKQPVTHPHSLCSYHRTQLQSYAKGRGGNPKISPKPLKKRAAAAVGSGSNSFYYYSNFGPWRGKRRGGASADTKTVVEEVDEEMESDDHNVRDGGDNVADKIDNQDGDNLDEDSDEDKRSTNRRRRKPVKARSLKSLL